MNSNELKLAKQYEKKGECKKAVECFEQYMSENSSRTESVYVSYARCLRLTGQLNEAKMILQDGFSHYPQSENILAEFFRLYDHLGDWKDAKSIAEDLIELNPQEGENYIKLGKAYSWLNKKKQAEETYKTGLEYKHGIPFDDLKKKIQRNFTNHSNEIKTKYLYLGGKNNLGTFLHEFKGKKYITKISKLSISTTREENFYKDVLTNFPLLKDVVPVYVDSQTHDQIQYLTIEMLEGEITSKSLEEMIDVSRQISSIQYQDITNIHPNLTYAFSFKNRASSVVIFFTQIHREYCNQILFSALKEQIKIKSYPKEVAQIIGRLESLIMDNRLYAFINPNKHYSLLHGDFKTTNMKVNEQDNAVKLFDWAGFKAGPHFVDIARYVTQSSVSFSEVKESSLFNQQSDKYLSLIEQIFFLYVYILFYFVVLKNRKKQNEIITEFINPALTEMETIVTQFKLDNFGSAVQLFLDDAVDKTQQNKELKKRIANLEKEKNKTQTKLQNILNSKSWRITAPLRKFMEKKKKLK